MLVSQIIERLEQYPPSAELYVEYWDKETVEIMEDTTLTKDEWDEVVYHMELTPGYFFPTALRFSQVIEGLRIVPLTER